MTNKKENAVNTLFDSKEKSKDFYDNFIGLDEEASIGIFDYIPKHFLRRSPSFSKHFTSPTAVIVLENKGDCNALVYQNGLLRYKQNGQKVRYGNLPKEFDELVLEMLRHYNELKYFDNAAEKTQNLPITKSAACLYFDKKRYLSPLEYNGKKSEVQKEVDEIRKTTEKIYNELVSVVGDKAEAFLNNLDIDNLDKNYKKCYKKYEEKTQKSWDNFTF